jgi:hypothetical protein
MGSIESFSRPQTSELSFQDIMRIRPTSTVSTHREQITNMVHRRAVGVFGASLATQAEQVMEEQPHTPYKEPQYVLKGTQVIHTRYAPSITAVAAGLGWSESSPQLQLLCGRLYEHEINLRVQSDPENNSLRSLQTQVQTAIERYEATLPSVSNPVDMDTLLKFFTVGIPRNRRTGLLGQLRQGRINDFFSALAKYE